MNRKGKFTGIGLVALDVVLNGDVNSPLNIHVGGSCGNVTTILSFLGWESYPIARLAQNEATVVLIEELQQWKVNTSLLSIEENGSTPIIIHRILKDRNGKPRHKFEFRDPKSGSWLPRYKAVIRSKISEIRDELPQSDVYYFDRVSSSSIELARIYREKGSLVVFEPTSIGKERSFQKCMELAHVIKFSNDRIKNYKKLYPSTPVLLEVETCGSVGLNYRFKNKDWTHMPAYQVDSVRDTAGAGDWCTAGFISTISKSGYNFQEASIHEVESSLKYGQALGAINCFFSGARGLMNHFDIDTLSKAVEGLQNHEKFSWEFKEYNPSKNHDTNKLKFEKLLNSIS